MTSFKLQTLEPPRVTVSVMTSTPVPSASFTACIITSIPVKMDLSASFTCVRAARETGHVSHRLGTCVWSLGPIRSKIYKILKQKNAKALNTQTLDSPRGKESLFDVSVSVSFTELRYLFHVSSSVSLTLAFEMTLHASPRGMGSVCFT